MQMSKRLITVFSLLHLLGFSWPMLTMASADKAVISEEKMEEAKKLFDSPYTEENYYRTETLLVTATGSQVPVFKAPSVASVITAADIEAMGATSLDEVLGTVSGLHVAPSGLNMFSSIWSIRGIHTGINPQALLLINGIPLTSTYTGSRPSGYRMPVAMISRVEVVRGPGSAVHGADAFSGVVNVITKDNFEIDGTRAGVRYGSFDTSDVWLQHGGQYKGWDVFAGVETQKSQGDEDRVVSKDAIGRAGVLDTSYNLLTTNLGLRRGNVTMRVYGSLNNDNGMGPGGAQVITSGNKADGKQWIGDFLWQDKKLVPNWDLSLRLHTVSIKGDTWFQYYPLDFKNKLGNPIVDHKYSGIETVAFYEGFNRHKLRLAMGAKAFDVETDQYKNFFTLPDAVPRPMTRITNPKEIFMASQNRNLWFLSLQDEWYLAPKWTFTGGVRYDEYNDFGSTVNPRAALVWEPLYYLTTKLLYGRAFRAPSFSEQYLKNNPMVVGDNNIEPETIDTYELALDFQPSSALHGVVSLFTYKAEGLINAVNKVYSNYGEQVGSGFEIEVEWKILEEVTVRSNLAYQRSENRTTDSVVRDAPALQFYLNPHWQLAPDWSVDGQYFLVADRPRGPGDPRAEIDDYDLVNLTLRRRNIAAHWDAALALRNLFNEDVREPSYDVLVQNVYPIPNDYPMESRALWAELRCNF